MAKRRMIAQSMWTNRRFIRLNNKQRLLFIGLVTIADDEGRLWNDELSIKAKILPVDNVKTKEITDSLERMAEIGLIAKSDESIQLTGWKEHQTIREDRIISSVIPQVTDRCQTDVRQVSDKCQRNIIEDNIIQDNISEDNTLVQNSNELLNDFDEFWELYNKKVNRAKCERRWKRLKKSEKEDIFNTLPSYIYTTPDVQYRKNPLTYLNNRGWEDALIERKSKAKSNMERIMSTELS